MDKPLLREAAADIGARFERPRNRHYARNKLRMDPVYAAIADCVAGEPVNLLDVGCGLGLLGFFLRSQGFRGGYLGLDLDASKIEAARAAAGDDSTLRFEHGDASGLPDFAGHVALIDVLHYLPAEAQTTLLRQAAARVAGGGALLIRSVLRQPGWRFRITVWEEWFLHASGWMHGPARHFPTRGEIETPLRASGLVLDVAPLWGRTPFSSFLIVGRRPPG